MFNSDGIQQLQSFLKKKEMCYLTHFGKYFQNAKAFQSVLPHYMYHQTNLIRLHSNQ